MGAMIRTQIEDMQRKIDDQGLDNLEQALAYMEAICTSTAHALRCAVHRTYKATAGALVFHWDMQLNIPILADWEAIN